MTLTIRPATATDITALCDLNRIVQHWHADTYPEHFKKDVSPDAAHAFWNARLTEDDSFIDVALIHDAPAGYAFSRLQTRPDSFISHPRRRLHIEHIVTAPAHRRQGVARALMMSADSRARALDCHGMTLDSWAHNTEAHAAFEAAGLAKTRFWFAKRL